MAILSEVRFAHPDGALVDTLTAHRELDVTVVPDAQTDPEQRFYIIRFGFDDLDTVRESLAADHTVSDIRDLPGFEDQRLFGIEFSQAAKLLNPKVAEQGGFVLEAQSSNADLDRRGWRERWLLPDGEALNDVWEYARNTGFHFEVLDVRTRGRDGPDFAGSGSLTDEQREALLVAYDHGYFDEPREASLEDLAEVLDLTPAAVGGRIRRGMQSLIGMTILRSDRSGENSTEPTW